MNDRDQPPLFDLPSRPPVRVPKPSANPGKAAYTRSHPRVRTMCDDCIEDIHRRGVAVAPFPQVVRWRRRAGDDVKQLCEKHKQLWTERDG